MSPREGLGASSIVPRIWNGVVVLWCSHPFYFSARAPCIYPQLSAEAKARILSMIDRELSLAQLSEGASTPPGPTNDENIGSGDGSGDVVGGDGGREVASFAGEEEVGLLPRECSGAPAIAAVVAGNEEGGLRAELDAAKERLRLTIEQLRCAKLLPMWHALSIFAAQKARHICRRPRQLSAPSPGHRSLCDTLKTVVFVLTSFSAVARVNMQHIQSSGG